MRQKRLKLCLDRARAASAFAARPPRVPRLSSTAILAGACVRVRACACTKCACALVRALLRAPVRARARWCVRLCVRPPVANQSSCGGAGSA